MNIVVTGSSGFIGFHTVKKLSKNKNFKIFGIDNQNNYYDVKLKRDREKILKKIKNYSFTKLDITNFSKLNTFFKKNKINIVIHLAAQAGVRDSVKNPNKYFTNNIIGFFNIIQVSNLYKIKHLLFASTSSVYGSQNKFPLKENVDINKPLSFYAASKISNETIAYSYSNIFQLPCTCLRFFTVYGPYGRPDMALYKFTSLIKTRKTLKLYNNGNHIRDFTYVDDVVNYIYELVKKPSKHKIPYNVFNIGSNRPETLKNFLKIIEDNLKMKAKTTYLNIQKGDIYKTHADNLKINKYIKKTFNTPLKKGIKNFIDWFIEYHK